jgi:hypothetical protein
MQWNPAQLLSASPFTYTFFTAERITSSPTHLYQKDERALPGDLHSRKLSSFPPLLNVVSHTTTHFLFSLCLRLLRVILLCSWPSSLSVLCWGTTVRRAAGTRFQGHSFSLFMITSPQTTLRNLCSWNSIIKQYTLQWVVSAELYLCTEGFLTPQLNTLICSVLTFTLTDNEAFRCGSLLCSDIIYFWPSTILVLRTSTLDVYTCRISTCFESINSSSGTA